MKWPSLVLLSFLPSWLFCQDFSFSPGSDLTGEIDVDGYGVHQIDIQNNTADTLWLTWRLVENTLPEEWDLSLCDNVLCYGVMPTSADMNPIEPDSAAWIRMTTYPNNVAGSGYLHFWIYKTGFPQDHVTMTFHLSAGLTGTDEKRSGGAIVAFPNPTSGPLSVNFPKNTSYSWILYNALGQPLARGECQGRSQHFDLSTYPSGKYWLQFIQHNRSFVIPLQRI